MNQHQAWTKKDFEYDKYQAMSLTSLKGMNQIAAASGIITYN